MCRASFVAQTVKCLPAMWETRVQFLRREDPLEKAMAIHSSTLAWKIPWMEEPDRLQSMGSQSRTQLSDFTFTFQMCATLSKSWTAVGLQTYFQVQEQRKGVFPPLPVPSDLNTQLEYSSCTDRSPLNYSVNLPLSL